MSRKLRIETLGDGNFHYYESLTNCGKHAECYCAFWHQKWASMPDLRALAAFGKSQGWSAIEGYPFDASALERHKDDVLWPSVTKGFESAGFERLGPHWLSNPAAERSIYTLAIA